MQGIATCKKLEIEVLPPTLEEVSNECIPSSKKSVRLGLNICRYLKKAGRIAIQAGKKKPKTLTEFVSILDRSKLNVKQCKALAQAGFLDTVATKEGLKTRRAIAHAIETLYQFFKDLKTKEDQVERWQQRSKDREQEDALESQGLDWKQITGRERKTAVGKEPTLPDYPVLSELVINDYEEDYFERSMGEYEILGVCIDGFPIDYMNTPKNITSLQDVLKEDIPPGKTKRYRVAGIVTMFKEMKSKSKRIRGTMSLEDSSALVTATIPSFVYEKNRVKIDDRTCILAEIRVRADYEKSKDSDTEEEVLTKRIDLYEWEELDVKQEYRGTIQAKSVEDMLSLVKQGSHDAHIVMGPIEYRGK